LELESLLWFSGSRKTPPLVTTHPNTGGLPVLSDPLTQVLAGGNEEVGTGLLPGFRGGLGMWLDDCQSLGLGGGVVLLFGRDQESTFTSDGTTSLGLPFFNTSIGANDAYLVGLDASALGSNRGSISASSRLDFAAADAYLRTALIQNGQNRVDLFGGYLFARLDDSLGVSSTLVDGITNAIPNGTVFDITDTFSTENTFHGGQLGLMSEVSNGRWSLMTSTKFGLGNMQQRVSAAGTYVETGAFVVTENRGLFVQSSNVGNRSRNVFTFIPQLDLKLGYRLSSNSKFNVGYSLVYFDDVAVAGNQIDPSIDIANIFAVPNAPQTRFVSDSLILHGITLGLSYDF
jgi:hypothetical protein